MLESSFGGARAIPIALAFVTIAGCVGLVGDFSAGGDADGGRRRARTLPGSSADAAAPDGTTADTGAAAAACTVNDDCARLAVPTTAPPACAVFVCAARVCSLVATDADGDGHRAAACAVTVGATTVARGDDCDDRDPTRYPGNWDGPAVPGDPSRPDRCSDHVDHDCDGTPGDGVVLSDGGTTTCTCAPDENRACSAGTLGCPGGTQTCTRDGQWGACTGAATATVDPWTGPLGAPGSGWTLSFGDPVVDVATHRLRLSYDDVVSRDTPMSGSYFVSHDLTLSGGTVFTPTVYVDAPFLPSIRRAGGDMQLGGDSYAGTWSDTLPAGFAGKRIAVALTARVTTYVRAQSRQEAVKVEAGGAVYRSGWAAPFTWPMTNVSQVRLIGQNNSSVYAGADDFVYVGPLRGCAGMDDAAVVSAYEP
jgi:hypothetical protein